MGKGPNMAKNDGFQWYCAHCGQRLHNTQWEPIPWNPERPIICGKCAAEYNERIDNATQESLDR
jgi:hypothetical protein